MRSSGQIERIPLSELREQLMPGNTNLYYETNICEGAGCPAIGVESSITGNLLTISLRIDIVPDGFLFGCAVSRRFEPLSSPTDVCFRIHNVTSVDLLVLLEAQGQGITIPAETAYSFCLNGLDVVAAYISYVFTATPRNSINNAQGLLIRRTN